MLNKRLVDKVIGLISILTILTCTVVPGACTTDDTVGEDLESDDTSETESGDIERDLGDSDPVAKAETQCEDGVDDDGDGLTDCDDDDCSHVPSIDGACMNEQDLSAINAVDYNLAWNECVVYQGCMWEVDCNTTCFEETVGVTSGCARCFAHLVECWISNCGAVCQNGGVSDECQACASEHCRPSYGQCIGQLVCKYEFACLDTSDNDDDGLVDLDDPDCQ